MQDVQPELPSPPARSQARLDHSKDRAFIANQRNSGMTVGGRTQPGRGTFPLAVLHGDLAEMASTRRVGTSYLREKDCPVPVVP